MTEPLSESAENSADGGGDERGGGGVEGNRGDAGEPGETAFTAQPEKAIRGLEKGVGGVLG